MPLIFHAHTVSSEYNFLTSQGHQARAGHRPFKRRPNMRRCVGVLSRLLILSAIAGLLAACASHSNAPAPRSAASPAYNYLIGPGDALTVVVWRNPDLSTSVTVRPDGKITVPLVEDLPAIGKDSSTLARDVEKALAKYIRDPVVTIIVTGFIGPYSEQIRVVGEAAHPQALPYRQNMTLLDVMIAVGGITDFADGNRAKILRPSDGNKLYDVHLKDLLRRGDISANVDVKPGDVLIIPQSWF
jgi:polysaccharide biosynthesis/export protein